MFINGHQQLGVIEDCKIFFNKIEKLKPYIVEFDKDGVIKPKVYALDCIVGGNNQWPIIVITHDKYTFFANNEIQKAWARKDNTFLYPKG